MVKKVKEKILTWYKTDEVILTYRLKYIEHKTQNKIRVFKSL